MSLVRTCTEDFDGFAFTRFDGTPVTITRRHEWMSRLTSTRRGPKFTTKPTFQPPACK